MRKFLPLLVLLLTAVGCGADTPASDAPAVAATAAAAVDDSNARERALDRREARLLRRERAVRRRARARRAAARALKRCDANISVRAATTTCAFAQNVFAAYWAAGSDAFEAYSAAGGRSYRMSCRGTVAIRCGAGDGGLVAFAASAVEAYSQGQYDEYVCSHDTGDPTACVEDDEPQEEEPSGDCSSDYEGACLDPTSADYDCDGGSGDGPDYTGMVTVVGDDVFDLDRDGDGIACDV